MNDNEQKKTDPQTFEARMQAKTRSHYGEHKIYAKWVNELHTLAREADQRIAQQNAELIRVDDLLREANGRLTDAVTDLAKARADLGRCVESAPLELVEVVEELIVWAEEHLTFLQENQHTVPIELTAGIQNAQATIERWKV